MDKHLAQEWRRKMFFGRIAYAFWMTMPDAIARRCFGWMLPSVGFYAYDEGCASYVERAALIAKEGE